MSSASGTVLFAPLQQLRRLQPRWHAGRADSALQYAVLVSVPPPVRYTSKCAVLAACRDPKFNTGQRGVKKYLTNYYMQVCGVVMLCSICTPHPSSLHEPTNPLKPPPNPTVFDTLR